MELLLIDR